MKCMKPIKVLEVIRQGQIGGGESHVLDLIRGFASNEVEPIAMAFTPGQMIDTLEAEGVRCYVIETDKAFDLKIQQRIKKVIEKEQIDIIHAHGSRAASNVFLLAKHMHLPMIYTVHGWSFHQDQPWLMRKLRAWSEKLICHYSKKVICVSESNRMTGEEVFGLKNAVVIENGINLKRFNPDKELKDIRQELGINKDEFIIGFIARITLQKAPLDFIKSVALAHKENPRIKGLLVGEGDMRDEVYVYIREHNLEDCFYLSKFRTDVPDLLSAIDVYCLPSLWEGLSIALLEAMAMRKALVVTPTDGTKELIVNHKNGIIVDFNSPESLAKAYLRYLQEPELIKQYGTEAQTIIQKRFNSQRVSDEVTEIYKELSTNI